MLLDSFKETETLADRLIHDQVKCAQQEEEICVLKRQVLASDKKSTKEVIYATIQITSRGII